MKAPMKKTAAKKPAVKKMAGGMAKKTMTKKQGGMGKKAKY